MRGIRRRFERDSFLDDGHVSFDPAPSLLVVIAEGDDLPWVEGVEYARRCPDAPSLWLPLHWRPEAPGDLLRVTRLQHDSGVTRKWSLETLGKHGKVFLANMFSPAEDFGACALRRGYGPEVWRIFAFGARLPLSSQPLIRHPGIAFADIALPNEWRAVGLCCDTRQSVVLVLLDYNRRQLAVTRDGLIDLVHRFGQTVAKLTVCPVSGLVAVLTQERQLVVYDIRRRIPRLQVEAQKGDGDGA